MKPLVACLPRAAFLLLVISATGCEDKAIGRLCDVGIDAGTGSSTEAVINGAALECPSRICLAAVPNSPAVPSSQYGGEQPVCTTRCSNDDDCGDGLIKAKGASGSEKFCHTKFRCAVATTTGPFCCEKLCICADYLSNPIQTPAACDPTNPDNKARCNNI